MENSENKFTLFVGIDFGMSKISIVTSRGDKKVIQELPESYKVLFAKGKHNIYDSAFSQQEKGSTKEEGMGKVVEELIDDLLFSVIEPPLRSYTSGVLSLSGGIDLKGLGLLRSILEKRIHIIDMIPSSLATAYSMTSPGHCMIVDIGANTVDICRFYGAVPSLEDQAVLYKAGNYIDTMLRRLLRDKFRTDFVDSSMLSAWKEKYGTVSKKKRKVTVKFMVHNKVYMYDIASEMADACCSIVPGIIEAVNDLIDTYDADFRSELRNNIILTGRGALISGLLKKVTYEFKKQQEMNVTLISDPVYAPAIGGLTMAKDRYRMYME